MDKRITFRFYKVIRNAKARINFGDALIQISHIPLRVDRERQLATDFHVRAETIAQDRGAIVGEMTRIQRTNFPSEIDGENRIALQTRNPLGHGIVFRYLPGSSDLGIQYDSRVLSPSRFLDYVANMLDDAIFDIEPIVRDDMWDRFRASPVRKLSISIARPSHIERLDRGPAATAIGSIRDMAEAYEAPTISIEMSMGRHRDGALAESVKGIARHLRQHVVKDQVELTRMRARIRPGDERPEEIDLLEDILSVKNELSLRDNDPDANYALKLSALREAMHEWIQ